MARYIRLDRRMSGVFTDRIRGEQFAVEVVGLIEEEGRITEAFVRESFPTTGRKPRARIAWWDPATAGNLPVVTDTVSA